MDEDQGKAERYRQRAEEVRVIADGMKNLETRRALMKVSEEYLDMAETMDRILLLAAPRVSELSGNTTD